MKVVLPLPLKYILSFCIEMRKKIKFLFSLIIFLNCSIYLTFADDQFLVNEVNFVKFHFSKGNYSPKLISYPKIRNPRSQIML